MPQGNAHMFPPGLWVQRPKNSSIPMLVLGTIGKIAVPFVALGFVWCWSLINCDYVYTSFKGKSISMGHMSQLTHEPLSVEEIDRLKREQAQRRKMNN